MNDFNIIIGGEISVESVNASLKSIQSNIQPLKLKIEFDTSDLDIKLKSINAQIQENLAAINKAGVPTQTGNVATPISFDNSKIAENVNKVITEYDAQNQVIKQSIELLGEKGDRLVQVSKLGESGSLELVKSTQTENTYLKENEALYAKIKQRIADLNSTGSIGTKATKDFNTRLEEANKLSGQEKNQAFKSLNQSISDSRKQVRGFGADLKTAFEKMAVWLIAGDIFFKIIRGLKDAVEQVKELDKAFTSLQMVTQAADEELAQMNTTYIQMGKELGATLTDITAAADDYLRAGKSVAETNALIADSITLAKIANIDESDATTYLIAAMNAYGLSAEQVASVVDKLSAVDIAASVSSEGLAISMSKTASSAKLAGVSMDKLFGYIAAVKEVSQESDEAIGNFYKTLFARMQQVKIGSLTDEEGQDISNVQTVLKEYGIEIMDATGDLRNMGDVLDELSTRWDKFTTAQKSEIATTLAGVRQRDRLLILLDNYDRSLALEQVSLESAGSAAEKYAIYNDSIEAALNRQKLAWQELAQATIDSDFIKFFVNIGTALEELLTQLGGLQALIPIIIGIIATVKAESLLKTFKGIGTWLGSIGSLAQTAGGGFKGLTTAIFGTATATSVLQASFAALTLIITAVMVIVAKHKQQVEEDRKAQEEYVQSLQDSVTALKDLKAEYLSLYSKIDKTESDKERLVEITEQLASAYGLEKDALDKLNGSYAEASIVLDEAIYKANEEYINSQKQAFDKAKDELEKTQKYANIKVPYTFLSASGKNIPDIMEQAGFEWNGAWEIATKEAQTPEKRLESLKKLRNLLNQIQEPTKYEVKFLNSINTAISNLSKTIDDNQKIVDEYNEKLKYNESYKKASSDLSLFAQQVDEFTKSSLADQITAMGYLRENLDTLIKKYPELSEYITSLATDFTTLEDSILQSDYALEILDKQLAAAKSAQEVAEKEKEEQEKLLKIEEAREKLAQAKEARDKAKLKQVKIYREGKGFVYESDLSGIQEAEEDVQSALSDLNKLLSEQEYQKTITEFETLQDVYNQAILDNSEATRQFFRDSENLLKFEQSSYTEKLDMLKQFLSDAHKAQIESGLFDFSKPETGGTITEDIIGTPSSTPTPFVVAAKTDAEKQSEWDAIKYNYGAYISYMAGDTPEEVREELRLNGNRIGTDWRNNLLKFLQTGAPKYHTGGIAGIKNFNPAEDVVSVLKKGESIFTQPQTKDISKALVSKEITNKGSTISIGNITLPDVSNATDFIKALENISTMASQRTNKRG